MRSVVCFWLLTAGFAWADQAADRASIEKAIGALNSALKTSHAKLLPTLFSSEADAAEVDEGFSVLDRQLSAASREPLSELTRPHIIARSMRFITDDVAVVDCSRVQYGSVILSRSVPVLLIFKRGPDGSWRIECFRVMAERASIPL